MLKQANDGGILRLTISRPERKNALTQALLRELREALRDAAVDPAVTVVVLTGDGDIFSAGGDLDAMHATDPEDRAAARSAHLPAWDTAEARTDRILRNCEGPLLLHEMLKPTIARVRGPAVGAALSHVLACDFRYIDRSARFVTGFARIALPGDLGIAHFLQTLVGPAKARELLMFGDPLDADAIAALGMANGVADDAAGLDAMVDRAAEKLAAGPSLAYRCIKTDLLAAARLPLRDALSIEAQSSARCLYSADADEARTAFSGKAAGGVRRPLIGQNFAASRTPTVAGRE